MRRLCIGILFAGFISTAGAVTLIDTDFTSPYSTGDLAGQQGWAVMPQTGTLAFEVDATAGVADTQPYAAFFNPTNGNYVYLSPSNAVGNAVDDEWDGSMVFTLTAEGTDNLDAAQEIYSIGFTAAATNRLNHADDGDVHINVRSNNDEIWVTLSKAGRFRTLAVLSVYDIGWNPTNGTPDLVSDPLLLDWSIRKTRTDGAYSASASLSNTVTTVASVPFDPDFHGSAGPNLNYMINTNTYPASALTLAMGHDPDADNDGTSSLIHISIDSLSVEQTSGIIPVLEPAALSAEAGSEEVQLSWTTVVDATNYEIYRSLTQGVLGSLIASTTDTSYLDTGLSNDTVYYYVVRATSAGAVAVDSNEASAEPQSAATGLIIDTSFSAADVPAYADGDIDGQNRWKTTPLINLPAFEITDAAGLGFADSEPYTNSFDTTLGNGIYFNRLMSNNVGDEWSCSMTFTLKTTPVAGQAVTDGTNTYDVAALSADEIFKIGLSADPSSGLEFNDADDIFVVIRNQISGRLDFQLNSVANQERKFGQLNATDVGWDPNWDNAGETPAPDFETDPITMNFLLRKATSPADTYTLLGEVICNGITNQFSEGVVAYDGSTGAYAANFVYMCMGIDEEANKRKALVTTNGLTAGVDFEGDLPFTVAVDSLSVTKADEQPPILTEPVNILTDVSDGTAILSWLAPAEAQGYTVRRYATYGGGAPVITLVTGLGDTTYSDTGLTNGWTYFYTVASEFGAFGEAESAIVPVRPLGKSDVLSWCFSPDAVAARIATTVIAVDTYPNGVLWSRGDAGTDGLMYSTGEVNPLIAPSLRFFGQIINGLWAQTRFEDNAAASSVLDYAKLRTKSGVANGYYSGLVYMSAPEFNTGSSFNVNLATYAMELETYNNIIGQNPVGVNIPGASLRAAVRSGGQWYVSQTDMTADSSVYTILDMASEMWASFSPALTSTDVPVTVTGAVFNVPGTTLTAVDAVGYFADHMRNTEVAGFRVTAGETATAYQLYTDGYLIFNQDAEAANDYDADGVENLLEWAFLGDPTNASVLGRQPRQEGLDDTGNNIVYIYPRLEDEPRPAYSVVKREDLYFPTWDPSSAVETGAGLWNTNNPSLGLEAVTNLVPIDVDTKTFTVEVSEE